MTPLVSVVLIALAIAGLLLGRLATLQAGALTLAALLLLPVPDAADGAVHRGRAAPAATERPVGYGPGTPAWHYREGRAHDPSVPRGSGAAAAEPTLARAVAPPDSPGPDSLLAMLAWTTLAGSTLAAVGRRRLRRARDALSTALFVRLVGGGGDGMPPAARCDLCERAGPARECPRCAARRSARLDA